MVALHIVTFDFVHYLYSLTLPNFTPFTPISVSPSEIKIDNFHNMSVELDSFEC